MTQQYTPSDTAVAAVLSDVVYHSADEVINTSTLGWVPVIDPSTGKALVFHDSQTGYYGEAWGKPNPDGNGYSEIMQVNRGTVIGTPGVNTTNPDVDLSATATNDTIHTLEADATVVVLDTTPSYVDSAQVLLTSIQNNYGSVPIIEAGQSLGGLTADALVAKNADYASGISAITINALPYTEDMALADNVSQNTLANLNITNNYVGNEVLTQNWFLGTPIGTTNLWPDLPVDGPTIFNTLAIHSAEAGVAMDFLSENPPGSPNYLFAKAWLAATFPNNENPDTPVPAPIAGVLGGYTSDDDATTYKINADGSLTQYDNNNSDYTTIKLNPSSSISTEIQNYDSNDNGTFDLTANTYNPSGSLTGSVFVDSLSSGAFSTNSSGYDVFSVDAFGHTLTLDSFLNGTLTNAQGQVLSTYAPGTFQLNANGTQTGITPAYMIPASIPALYG